MKSWMKLLGPHLLLHRYRDIKLFWDQRRNARMTTEDIFTEIYRKNKWGGVRGDFYSGSGSTEHQVVAPYIAAIARKASSEPFGGLSFVDLGCGDFRVGSQLIALCTSYVGVDIVNPLVQSNQRKYGNDAVRFMHLDITQDELPDGDVCFLRQVLQHLSNQQIMAVLAKVTKYQWVFVTEHYPTERNLSHNIDKAAGFDTRVRKKSGVYLTDPPFDLPAHKLEQVLEVLGTSSEEGSDPGVIRTFLYKPAGRMARLPLTEPQLPFVDS